MNFKTIALHLSLFILALITTTLTGAEYIHGNTFFAAFSEKPLGWAEFWSGMQYSLPLMGALLTHEFGHYFMALRYHIRVSLPYCIPLWIPAMPQIGTMGAIIKIRSAMPSRKALFDVGVAGPLAGFAVGVCVLIYGLTHLPPPEYVFQIHPEWAQYGLDYPQFVYKDLPPQPVLGSNLLFELLKGWLVTDASLWPPVYEVLHYPYILAAYFVCFFTALNLFPIGQLDGGHVIYGLFGRKWHGYISAGTFLTILFFGGLGSYSLYDSLEDLIWGVPMYVLFLYFILERLHPDKMWVITLAVAIFFVQFVIKSYILPNVEGFQGWLVYAFVLGRFVGIGYPPVPDDAPLNGTRKAIGWLMLIIFVLCFAPMPLIIK